MLEKADGMESFNAVSLVGELEVDMGTACHGAGSQVTRFTVRLEEQEADKVPRVSLPVECWGKTAARAADRRAGDLSDVQGDLVYRRGEPTGWWLGMASSVVCLVAAPAAGSDGPQWAHGWAVRRHRRDSAPAVRGQYPRLCW
jgi:hypothetical protein